MIENQKTPLSVKDLPKPAKHWPGMHPYSQGQFAAIANSPRKPPESMPGHDDPEFQKLWLAGYDAEVDCILKREILIRERLESFSRQHS